MNNENDTPLLSGTKINSNDLFPDGFNELMTRITDEMKENVNSILEPAEVFAIDSSFQTLLEALKNNANVFKELEENGVVEMITSDPKEILKGHN